MNWVQEIYFGNEGTSVSICAAHLRPTQRDFTVNITEPDTPGTCNMVMQSTYHSITYHVNH